VKILVLIIYFFCFIGCTSTTVIRSRPLGADLYIDNELVGKTPFVYTDRKWFLGQFEYRLVKEGYHLKEGEIKRSQEWDVGAILGYFSLPWARKYKSEQIIELNKISK
jgi:hypothetical protein